MLSTSSTIIETNYDRGLALMSYYYFDFKDIAKQGMRGLLASLLPRFCAKSDPRHQIVSGHHSENEAGSR